MDSGPPVFDFDNPWVALIQVLLFYVLPRLVGLVTDKLTASWKKITILGVLAVAGSALTWLLDVATASTWSTVDWTDLVNVVVNSAITFAMSQAVYRGVIVPLGQADKDAASTAIKFFGPDQSRMDEYTAQQNLSAESTIARREAAASETAARVAREVVKEELAKVPRARVSSATAAKKKAEGAK